MELNWVLNREHMKGRGGGQVFSILAFYSNNLSSNPAEVYDYKNKQKEAGFVPLWKYGSYIN